MHSEEGWVFLAISIVIGLIGGGLLAWALVLAHMT